MNIFFTIPFFIVLFSCSELNINKGNEQNPETQIEADNECKVHYETYIKKRGKPVTVLPERVNTNKNVLSQIMVVTIRLSCKNANEKLINQELLDRTVKSGLIDEENVNSLNDLLATIDSSGVHQEGSKLKYEEATEFIRNIDNEVIFINDKYISVKTTDEYQVRISRPIVIVSTITMKLSTGEKIDFKEIIKKEKYNELEKHINDSVRINFKDFYSYNNDKIDIQNLYNVTDNGILFYFQSYGNRFATVEFKKDFIRKFINVDFWD